MTAFGRWTVDVPPGPDFAHGPLRPSGAKAAFELPPKCQDLIGPETAEGRRRTSLTYGLTSHRQTGVPQLETTARGPAVLASPILNKGTAFTAEERAALGLTGLLPPHISTLETQVRAAYIQYGRLPDALSKNVYLTALHDRNEVLFYRLFSEHLREMIPIVNDLTVGMAMEQYHHECRGLAAFTCLSTTRTA